MDKESIRKDLISKLSLLSEDEIQALSFALTTQIIKFLHSRTELNGQIGAGYLPLKAEVAPVYQELLRAVPLNIAFPILKEGEMSFGLPHGLAVGTPWLEPPYLEVEPQWLLIPGVGFTQSGARLGRGKGFYDRFLEGRKVLKVGLAWSQQVIEEIPVESHDSHMDYIITEKYCWDVEQQKSF